MNAQPDDLDVDGAGHDMATERWLLERGVTFNYDPAYPVAQIDHAASLANQARLEAVDGDVVERYQADMERGDTFPALLARTRKRGRSILLGGNHRYAAHLKAGHATIPVYLVDCEPEMATRLMYEDNRRHGLPPSDPERIAQALHLVDQGWTQQAAAECVGITLNKVNLAAVVIKADRRAKTLGVERWPEIPKTLKQRLMTIRPDVVFKRAAEVVAETGLGQHDVFPLVTKLNEARSEQAALDLLDATIETHKLAGGGTKHVSAKTRVLSALSSLEGVDPGEVAGGCANKDQALVLGRRIAATQERLKLTLLELKARW